MCNTDALIIKKPLLGRFFVDIEFEYGSITQDFSLEPS